jgi:hypothetical protein
MKKTIIILAIVAIAATSFAAAPQLDKSKLDKAIQAYTMALNSDNPGLRNSALYQLAVLKNKYPEANFISIERVIDRMAKQDKSLSVRLNANLISQYLTDEELATKVNPVIIDSNAFFSELYTQVTNAK